MVKNVYLTYGILSSDTGPDDDDRVLTRTLALFFQYLNGEQSSLNNRLR